ncbi:MAG TPA: hypothetical protein VF173_18240 [Thermoanaerobaculia bacterium]|nr:hypothetical protein [Thermoanaerobaculia bacterium]
MARLRPNGEPATVALPDAGSKPVRLSLVSVPGQPGASMSGGLVLRRPLILSSAGAGDPQIAGKAGAAVDPSVSPVPLPRRPRNVILYLVDTLRADHLGCYGYSTPVPVSPRSRRRKPCKRG